MYRDILPTVSSTPSMDRNKDECQQGEEQSFTVLKTSQKEADALANYEKLQNSFEIIVTQLDRSKISRTPITPVQAKHNENDSQPFCFQPRVRLKRTPLRINQQILAPETPKQIMSQSVPQTEELVPETQPEDEQQVKVTPTREARALAIQKSGPEAEEFIPETQTKVVQQDKVTPVKPAQATNTAKSTAELVSRSIQTTKNSNHAIMIDLTLDDNDGDDKWESSTVALDLAPVGGNTTRQRRVRQHMQRIEDSDDDDDKEQLLDLHRTGLRETCNQGKKLSAKIPLNKPSMAAINGEKFAEELTRMSNYEILDLRKRNSLGLLLELNHEKFEVEQSIQWEILRRNLKGDAAGLPPTLRTLTVSETTTTTRNESIIQSTPAPPPDGYRDSLVVADPASHTTVQLQSSPPAGFKDTLVHDEVISQDFPTKMQKPAKLRNSRSKSRGVPMTEELKSYIELSETIDHRVRSKSGSNGQKRSLYTKGNSDGEESPSPEKKARPSRIQIMSSPQKQNEEENIRILSPPPPVLHSSRDIEDIRIVSPPPASVRYSQSSPQMETTQHIERVETLTVLQINEPPSNEIDERTAPTTYMEELRVQSPTPQMPSLAPSAVEQSTSDDQPSTSRAARKALQLSLSMKIAEKQSKREKQRHKSDDTFKKPTGPAPRSKSRMKNELRRLQNTLVNRRQLEQPKETELTADHETTDIRRSKRGQVPLRNDFCHTFADPFNYMFGSNGSLGSSISSRKSRPVVNKPEAVNNKQSIFSSTPRTDVPSDTSTNLKRKREQQDPQSKHLNIVNNFSGMSGISELSQIAEEMEHQEEKEIDQPKLQKAHSGKTNEDKKRKKEKKKKIVLPEPPMKYSFIEPGPVAEAEIEPEPEKEAEIEVEIQPEIESEPVPVTITSQNTVDQAYSWLDHVRGVTDMPTSSNADMPNPSNESMLISTVQQLEFSNVDGIDYGFYTTEDKCCIGYIRFKPLQERGVKRNKTHTL
ncbi:Cenp-C, partial [Drosophila busckii]